MSKKIFTLSTLIFSVLLCLSLAQVKVKTSSGEIEGKIVCYDKYLVRQFLGVPYAKPPIGALRFKKPVPMDPWNKTRKTKAFGSGCIQYTPLPFPWKDDLPGLSEDCLFLNIWVPVSSKKPKTVMFWINTGGFVMSSSRVDFFNGKVMAALGDVIVVSINYRLGPFGFLYSGTDAAPGNMGALDVVEALKWVNKNIHSFGGDDNSITLFGESAGAMVTGMLCVSPLTRGLFRRVIMQSGSPLILNGKDNDLDSKVSQGIAEIVGCADSRKSLKDDPDGVVECLRGVDGLDLSKAFLNATKNSLSSDPVYPRYGDEFLQKDPVESIRNGDFADVDVLIGVVKGDGALLLTAHNKTLFGFFGEKNPKLNIAIGKSLINDRFKNYLDPDSVARQYLSNLTDNDCCKIRKQVFTAIGDFNRVCPAVYFAESFAKKNPSVYFYVFTLKPSNTPWAPWMSPSHSDETPFVFGYPFRYKSNYTGEERVLSLRMIKYWSNFAKFGNPTPERKHTSLKTNCPLSREEGLVWPKYSEENPEYQILNTDFKTACGPRKNNCDFFRPVFGF